MSDYLFSVILMAASFLVGWILYFIVMFTINRNDAFFKKYKIGLKSIKNPLRLLMPTLCVSIVIPFLQFPKNVNVFISHSIQIIFIGLFGWFAVKIAFVICNIFLRRYDINNRDNLHARRVSTQIRVITNIISVIIVFVTVSFMLISFTEVRQIGVNLLASAGIMGIVIGFAAQKTLGNLIAGIQIAIAQPIRFDDVVIIENEWGWIEEITLTFVVVRIWDLRRLVVPISYFLEKPFQNWTRTSADLLGTVLIYVDYTVPVDEIRNELTRILEKSSKWDKRVNVLQVTNMTEKAVELRALMSAGDSPTAWELRCEVREKLLQFLQERFPEALPRVRLQMDQRSVPTD